MSKIDRLIDLASVISRDDKPIFDKRLHSNHLKNFLRGFAEVLIRMKAERDSAEENSSIVH